ncbi:hypothetical protein [Alkalihalobacterium chitinilyticum]|uniref:DUF4179 domain-containing protein n=1 Tax=Alkalihalobacterium chitinilyticum TaxID=2980103 RepID=A0ABT5VLF1_9BACI|nr:hypothetical protein [Alkalihalobacterium chitinilyticum]MDE5416100.1 hypothetical protein [Alkalihalobacterium chitinilyticum]
MDNKDNFDLEEFANKMKQLPKVKDHRSKDEIFRNIQKQIKAAEPQKRRRPWLMPTLASATAAVLLLALIPMILSNGSEEALPYAEEAEAGEMFMVDMDEALEEATETTMEYTNYISAIIESNLQEDQRVVTIPFLDEQAMFIVPLSFIVRDDDTVLNQISSILEEYDPSTVGLLASPLEGVTMEEVSNTTVSVNIPQVPAGSANENMLMESIKSVIEPLGYERFNILVDGQRGVDIGSYGPVEEMSVTSAPSGYTAYENSTGRTFLVVGGLGEVTGLNFEDIVQLMTSVTSGIVIDTIETSDQAATILFGQGTELTIHEEALILVEAILLTAKDFKIEEVEFKNAGVEEFGPYQLNDRISTEISPNGIAFR